MRYRFPAYPTTLQVRQTRALCANFVCGELNPPSTASDLVIGPTRLCQDMSENEPHIGRHKWTICETEGRHISIGVAEKLPKLAAADVVPTPIMLWPSPSSD